MIIAITPPNSRSNLFSTCSVKCSVNVFYKAFFRSGGIKLVGSFFLATLLVVTMYDFQI